MNNDLLNYIFFSFGTSFFVIAIINILSKKTKIISTDHLHNGPQKLHKNSIPRIGGLGIFLGMLTFVILSCIYKEPFCKELFLIFVCSLPVFITGIWEDLTCHLKSTLRLFLTSISGMLIFFLFGGISNVGLPIFDYLLGLSFVAFVFTVFAITGVVHSFNIIDGCNGVASFISMMNLYALTIIACKTGDMALTVYGVVFISIIVAFFLFNWPFGTIFLGDGGAYLIGYLIAIMSVLILIRHPEVSAWAILLINIYPVFETIFSVIRRKISKSGSTLSADSKHLHTLIYNNLNKRFYHDKNSNFVSSFSSIFLWILNIFAVIPAIVFQEKTSFLILFCFIFIILYLLIYKELSVLNTSYSDC